MMLRCGWGIISLDLVVMEGLARSREREYSVEGEYSVLREEFVDEVIGVGVGNWTCGGG